MKRRLVGLHLFGAALLLLLVLGCEASRVDGGRVVATIVAGPAAAGVPSPSPIASASNGVKGQLTGGASPTARPTPLPLPTPTAAPTFTATPVPATATPTPLPPTPTPITGNVNLTGRVASDIAGTLIAPEITVISVVDRNTKPRDVYDLYLTAGQTLELVVDAPYRYWFYIANPGSLSFDRDRWTGRKFCAIGCAGTSEATFYPAVSGTYYLAVSTDSEAIRYSLRASIR